MTNLTVYSLEGKEVSTIKVSDDVFASNSSVGIVHQALVWYQAGQRAGTASTKTRAEVRGGGKKPWNQKGTGRARAGSIRSPLWRGGGVIFGPKPRDYSFSLSKKARKAALRVVLSDRVKSQALKVIEEIKIPSGKTKDAVNVLKPFSNGTSLLLIADNPEETLKRATKNLKKVKVVDPKALNIQDLLAHGLILVTKKALVALEERVAK